MLARRPAAAHQRLSAAEREHLDQRGYLLLSDVLLPAEVAAMRQALERRMAPEVTNPQNIPEVGDVFDVCLTHPRVLEAVMHVIGPSVATLGIYSRLLAPSEAVSKSYKEALHTDWSGHLHADGTMHLSDDGLVVGSRSSAPRGPPFHTCNTHWMLSDFSRANGATRVVPGSVRAPPEPCSSSSFPSLVPAIIFASTAF